MSQYSDDILFACYDEDYEASEDSEYYNGVIHNPKVAVFLIDRNELLKAYPEDSEQYADLSRLGDQYQSEPEPEECEL